MEGMLTGLPAGYSCVKAFAGTELTDDLKKIDLPVLSIHGEDDQIVPIAGSTLRAADIGPALPEEEDPCR